MFNHRLDETPSNLVVLHWLLLSFNGGYINAGGFLATGRFVSHVTGFATLFGVHLANHEFDSALGILSVPIFFLFGAFFAGLMIDRQIYKGKKAHFDYVMGLSSICLFVTATGGELLNFGIFGGYFSSKTGLYPFVASLLSLWTPKRGDYLIFGKLNSDNPPHWIDN